MERSSNLYLYIRIMSEKNWKNYRATYGVVEKEPQLFPKMSRRVKGHSIRFKNKKHTLGRLKWATHLNNWNNVPYLCPRGTATPEEYAIYMKYKNK